MRQTQPAGATEAANLRISLPRWRENRKNPWLAPAFWTSNVLPLAARSSRHRCLRGYGFVLASALVVLSLLHTRECKAQLHWDASAQLGVMKRFLGNRPGRRERRRLRTDRTAHRPSRPLAPRPPWRVFRPRHLAARGETPHRETSRSAASGRAGHASVGPRHRPRVDLRGLRLRRRLRAELRHAPSLITDDGGRVAHGIAVARPGRRRRILRCAVRTRCILQVFQAVGALRRAWRRVRLWPHGERLRVSGSVGTGPGLPRQNAAPAGLDRFALGLTVGVLIDFVGPESQPGRGRSPRSSKGRQCSLFEGRRHASLPSQNSASLPTLGVGPSSSASAPEFALLILIMSDGRPR